MKEITRRKIDNAFKLMVVELQKSGKSSSEIGQDLDIPSDMVIRWCREYAASSEGCFTGIGIPIFTP